MNITINNIKKCFGTKIAVNINSFEVKHGEIIGLVGNNGAGKTTLFRLMLDLLKPDEGYISYQPNNNGAVGEPIDPAKSEDWKPYTGSYIDNSFLIDFMTPDEYFEFIAHVSGISKEEAHERLKTFTTFLTDEISGQKKYIRDLSAGNKQKVGIVAALLTNPQMVILDEPFNFLDPSSQNMLMRLLNDYNKHTGATIMVSSHNLQHTIDISTRIALLEHGVIIKDLDNTNGKATTELEEYFKV